MDKNKIIIIKYVVHIVGLNFWKILIDKIEYDVFVFFTGSIHV